MIKHVSELRLGDVITHIHGDDAANFFDKATTVSMASGVRITGLTYNGRRSEIRVTVSSCEVADPDCVFLAKDLVELESPSKD